MVIWIWMEPVGAVGREGEIQGLEGNRVDGHKCGIKR